MQASNHRASLDRRSFVAYSAAIGTLVATSSSNARLCGAELLHTTQPRRLLKTLKLGMVDVEGDLTAKFAAAKAAGFDGIEVDAPGVDIEATKAAIAATGLPVDGSVCSTHWQVRHSSPEAKVRAQALADLETAIRQTHAVGGHTVLLVVGHGQDGSEEQVWERSVENISKILPLCAELGITIAIENVWNQFCYQHGGPNNQSVEKFVNYVDEFASPWVGMQFDIGNHWKYGQPGDWIRGLGKRIVKLDIKGFSRADDKFTDITEGDLPWVDVRNALDEIHFEGWVAAEVNGGNQERLTKIAHQIDTALNIMTE